MYIIVIILDGFSARKDTAPTFEQNKPKIIKKLTIKSLNLQPEYLSLKKKKIITRKYTLSESVQL